jgi:hypothetical protein
VKKLTLATLALGLTASLFAADVPPPTLGAQAEKMIRENIPVCAQDQKVSRSAMQHKLPPNMIGTVIRTESDRSTCQAQWVAVITNDGDFFMGIPWFLDAADGTTLEERLKTFTWKGMQQNMTPIIDRTPTRNHLLKVTLEETTEAGKMPLEGEIDPAGTVFFVGHFIPLKSDVRAERMKAFEPFVSKAPTTGAANPVVTVIEFSDFECPSCMRASGYMKPIMDKYGSKVRYVRYDLPLVTMHPWAFAAAMAGRAVYDQKPDLFWTFKHDVYDMQEKLTAFTIDDFTRNWAKDHDLDMKKFDLDMADPQLRSLLLKGAGAAFTNDIRATPTYLVNGVTVDAGDGKALEAYVAKLVGSH